MHGKALGGMEKEKYNFHFNMTQQESNHYAIFSIISW